jgi:tetratricopeptide (TPR) repeat protein
VLAGIPTYTRRLDAPFVGRAEELARLRQTYETAREGGSCQLVTITGSPGIGKSRLVRELVTLVDGEARIVVGRCLSYGEGITYWPLAEIVREVAGSETRAGLEELLASEADGVLAAERILAAVGATDEPARTEEIFWATRVLFERLAHDRPLIAVVDDIHWAEPTLLDLVEYLEGFARAPILLACTARPDLFDARPHWPRGDMIELEALDDDQSDTLIDALVTEAGVSSSVHEQIRERAEGNPLFLEQMLAFAAENGAEDSDVPPTIHALLAARLDRLPGDERSVLVRGAVEGRLFHQGAVSALLSEGERDGVPGRLLTLTRKALIRPDESLFPGDDAFRFAHVLVRDAAYEGAPKELRADLHERFASWVEEKASERLPELEEIVGYHLEQSFLYRESLGEAAHELAHRAGERLAAAGRRALERGDVTAASKLLRRASDLFDPGEQARLELAPPLAEALCDVGLPLEAATVLRVAETEAHRAGLDRLEALCHLHRGKLNLLIDPEVDVERLLADARAAVETFDAEDDGLLLAIAWEAIQEVEWFRGHLGAARAAAEQALIYAERLGDVRRQAVNRSILGASGYFGGETAAVSIREAQEDLDWAKAHGVLYEQACAMHALGSLAIEQGRPEGYEIRERGWAILDELGMRLHRASLQGANGVLPGPRAMERGVLVARLRAAYDVLAAARETGALSTVAANLASVLYDAGEYEEAERLTYVSEEAGSGDDVVTQVGWRAARAIAVAGRGRLEEAETLARDALARALDTEYFLSITDAYLSLGEVLRLAGRLDEAREAMGEALAIFERKGLLLSADVVRTQIAGLHSGSPSQ